MSFPPPPHRPEKPVRRRPPQPRPEQATRPRAERSAAQPAAARPAPEAAVASPPRSRPSRESAPERSAPAREAPARPAAASAPARPAAAKSPAVRRDSPLSPEERRAIAKEFIATVDWDSYDYTAHPGANMDFPDMSAEDIEYSEPWPSKHYNEVGRWKTCHVIDLNEIGDGAERRMYALYGVPVEWPTRDEDEDALDELIDDMDRAREDGGSDWQEAMDSHGILNDEHYAWMRGRSLGMPEEIGEDYETARAAIQRIDAARKDDDEDVEDLLEELGFRDAEHFEWFRRRVDKAKADAWRAQKAVLRETHKMLDERFEKNKEALADELSPYKGISMEQWAGAMARISQGADVAVILGELGIEEPLWDEVSAEWNDRMSRDTTATIATVYGQAFTGAGAGAYGATGAAVSSSMQQGYGSDVGGGDPIPFEQWIKIQAHVSAASAQGVDVNTVLGEYGLNPADWGTIGGYWSMKMNSQPENYLEDFQTLTAKYTAEFASAGAGDDIDF